MAVMTTCSGDGSGDYMHAVVGVAVVATCGGGGGGGGGGDHMQWWWE